MKSVAPKVSIFELIAAAFKTDSVPMVPILILFRLFYIATSMVPSVKINQILLINYTK
jgi:hypothetical protein